MSERITLSVDSNLEEMIRMCKASLAQECFLDFVTYIFESEGRPYIVGKHTKELCARIDKALNDLFLHKISTYILVTLPFRHGKSELVSRLLTPFIIGKYGSDPGNNPNNPHRLDLEAILGTYSSSLSTDLSRDARRYMRSPGYQEVFPDVQLSKELSGVDAWAVDYVNPYTNVTTQICKFHAVGLLGGVTGKGARILIMDDILKNREEAESATYRDKQWEAYRDNFITRFAPEFLHILCATRWHVDDVLGRVLAKNDPESEQYDPQFPKFEVMHYRARLTDDPPTYLFPERFSSEWYERQFATLGPYSAPALLQGEPIAKGGNMFPVDRINLIDTVPEDLKQRCLEVRFWDLASTEKETNKDDPDATVGVKGFVWFPDAKSVDANDPSRLRPHFFVTDVRSCKLMATARNALIVETARSDGAQVYQGIESVAGYKDAFDTVKNLLRGVSTVHKVTVRKDKVIRASEVLPPMDAGWVYFVRGWWNSAMITEVSQFPSGKHDDHVDALAGCFTMAYNRSLKMLQSGYLGGAGFSSGRCLLTPTSTAPPDRKEIIESEFEELFHKEPVNES